MVKQKILKIWFCSLKLQICAHSNVEQMLRGEEEPGGTRERLHPLAGGKARGCGRQERPESEAHLMAEALGTES